ncbi:MAG: MarR family transcriptional regulator, partial [Elusimicrobia bacterium]|nr:MarR family transcriptional regulator [Elusimicrobiota bacterium]MBD3411570.1 MarR family transcriptional regulator [Elusimicrobiota bacterium]
MNQSDKTFKQLVCDLFKNLQVLDRLAKVESGLTVPQCHTLMVLKKSISCSMHDLSSEIGVTPSTMTRILDILVRDKLVERRHAAHDRRTIIVT